MKGSTAIAAGLMLGAAGLLLVWPAQAAEEGAAPGDDDVPAPESPTIWDQVKETLMPTEIDLSNPNLRAFLALIRAAEGTAGANGYRTLFGGGLFGSFADHPRVKTYEKADEFIRNGRKDYTTAAGAYQITETTWDGPGGVKSALNLPDFSPASQDMAAAWLIRRRGALRDVYAGRLFAALEKCNREWASLPGSPYGQPTITADRARNLFAQAGGNITEGGAYA